MAKCLKAGRNIPHNYLSVIPDLYQGCICIILIGINNNLYLQTFADDKMSQSLSAGENLAKVNHRKNGVTVLDAVSKVPATEDLLAPLAPYREPVVPAH